jgi:hypothetical protein
MPSLKAMTREAQKGPKVGPIKQTSKPKKPVFKSTERVADSDLESETESESGNDSEEDSVVAPPQVPKVNGQKKEPMSDTRDAATLAQENKDKSGSESESESEGSYEISNSRGPTHRRISSQSGSGSDTGANSESESEKEQEASKVTVVTEDTLRYGL